MICRTTTDKLPSSIMPPGTIHAVYTPRDTLLVGSFFYLASNFAITIQCIDRSIQGALRSNDDIQPADWEKLTEIGKHLDDPDLFNAEQREAIFSATFGLLVTAGCLAKVDNTSWDSRAEGKWYKGGRKELVPEIVDFLKVYMNWWLAYREQGEDTEALSDFDMNA